MTAHAYEASAPAGPPELDDLLTKGAEAMKSMRFLKEDVDEEEAEDKSPEKGAEDKSPESTELDQFCRRCSYRRTEPEDPFDKCECGIDCWDSRASDLLTEEVKDEPEETQSEEPAGHRTAVMLNLAP